MSPALKARFVLAGRLLALGIVILLMWRGPHLAWLVWPARTASIVVLDKTVAHEDYREHAALSWILRSLKVKTPDGRFYDPARDYVGFDPKSRTGRAITRGDLEKAEVLLVADTYGVYVADYKEPTDPESLLPSRRLDGGLTLNEAMAIDEFAARGGLVIAEFNTLASPTEVDARTRLEALFGFTWTHWVGRYFTDLSDDTELPRWVPETYERLYGKPLDRNGGALVFVKEDDLVVMHADVDLRPQQVMQIEKAARDGDAELASMPASGVYRYWLDIVVPKDADVLFEHVVQATDDGLLRLQAHGIPQRFPALVRRRGGVKAYYFAGDFVDAGLDLGDPERAGLVWWRKITHGDPESDGSCFWSWYAPILVQLLEPHFHKT